MYKYKVKGKGIFDREFSGIAGSKEEIEQATGVAITDGTWYAVEKGKKSIVEDEYFVVTIQKVK